MRKQGQNIIDKRLKLKRGLKEKFLLNIKEESNLTWRDLAKEIGISEHTLRVDWCKGDITLPYKTSLRLLKKYPFEKWEIIKKDWIEEVLPKRWGQKLAGGNNKKKIKIPNKCEKLAEIIGVILGDGHVGQREITITGEFPHQMKHFEYIKKNIKDLFGIDSRIFLIKKNNNTVILDCYSIELVKFLNKNGLFSGNKIKKKSSFPKWIFEDDKYIHGALRGLIDTDGGIYNKQKEYKRAIIEFQNHSPYIKRDIINFLNKIGFKPSKSSTVNPKGKVEQNIRIQNQNEVKRFFNLIGSSNPKNIIRYKHFIKEGKIPLKEDIKIEIKKFNESLPFKA
ncbi:MAG: hypothetical protein KJ674_05430 [Nanoarchaeota archaeon]|nr:hypothetical protein [Nanoarchaeota archaeon]